MEFGENLKNLREMKGLSQAELADDLGVTRALIAQYETGAKAPNVNLAAKIAKALGVTIDAMMQRKE
jgi:transcriptional regulator with XRE-family HTH domain